MTQTSYLILTKWENLVNLMSFFLDLEPHDITIQTVYQQAINKIKRSLTRFQKIYKLLIDHSWAGTLDHSWIYSRIFLVYWTWFFIKSLTWNKVIFSLLFVIGKKAYQMKNGIAIQKIYQWLSKYITFFEQDHLKHFFTTFNKTPKPQTPLFDEPQLENLEQTSSMLSSTILSKLSYSLQNDWYKQVAFFSDYILPATKYFLVVFWSSTLSLVVPITMSLIGEKNTVKVLSKL